MLVKRMILAVFLCSALLFAGCGGGGGNNVNGGLTVASSQTDSDTYSKVAFTVTYTNPTKSDVLGTPITITATSSNMGSETFTSKTNNSGVFTLTYLLPRDLNSDQWFTLKATTGDLVASDTAIVKKQTTSTPPTLTANPASVTIPSTATVGQSSIVAISGGNGPYVVLGVSPTPNADISASISGGTLTIAKTSTATGGSASILIGDSSTVQGTVLVTVTY